ncbi:MAG: hypothetical protein U1A53_18160 [Prosthecobacter sp.]|nr:hypothetical protein [Prosthecobacter sp.]
MFFVSVGFWPGARAQDAANKVVVTITTVKESDWQREMTNVTSKTALRERLQARTLVELTGELKNSGETVLRAGQERGIVTQWDFAEDSNDVVAEKTIQELIGTEVRLKKVPPTADANEPRLGIALTHDLQPPQLQSMTYATAATGAERDKLSVTAPRFDRLRWQGEVLPSKDERLLTSFLPAGDADTRIAVFIQGGGDSSRSAALEIQQTIYRVPEMDMIEWLMDGTPSDAVLVKRMQDAVTTGRASVVSRLTSSAVHGIRTQAQAGSEWWLPSEMCPNYDLLYQLPASFETALSGTRLEFQVAAAEIMFKSSFAQRAPLAVKWPTSWLHVYDRKTSKPTGKAIHGWMDWHDRFEQEIIAEVAFRDDSPHLVAMLPPADQTWGAERTGRWLDVTVLQQMQGETKPAPRSQPSPDLLAPADPFAPPGPFSPSARSPLQPPLLVLGIALDHDQAQALLATRQPEKDETLLRELVARVRRGEAHVVTCVLSAHEKGGVRRRLVSARQHVYPTEMPSIPSAWAMMPVGTRVELDGAGMDLRQDLAPPARTEWKLARDVPQAIMWEPRFRTLSIRSAAAGYASPGTHLCAVTDIPAVMSGGDLPEHETVFLFTHRPADGTTAAKKAIPSDFEVEALIFEIPASDAEDWQAVTTDEFAAFTQQRLKQGTAKLQSHSLLRVQAGIRGTLQVAEEYMTATEFDPPEPQAPFRMRPTALETLHVGLQFEVEVAEESGHSASLSIHLKHSTAKPIEPGLEQTLKIAASGHERYPGAKHEFEEWRGDALRSPPGTVHCLGLSVPPGGGVVSTRIAFVRVRPAQ